MTSVSVETALLSEATIGVVIDIVSCHILCLNFHVSSL